MLELPNLDDKTFEQLIDDAKKLINQYCPHWTDYNLSDPGVTFIELFAWLTEMQQYYLNRIRDASKLKYLKLLGVKPLERQSSKTFIVFETYCNSVSVFVPSGTILNAGEILFETEEPMHLLNLRISKIIYENVKQNDFVNYTDINKKEGFSFYPFGETANPESRFIMGFRLIHSGSEEDNEASEIDLSGKTLGVFFDIFSDYPVYLGNEDELYKNDLPCNLLRSENLTWECCFDSEQKSKLKVLIDETMNFSKSGRVVLGFPKVEDDSLKFCKSREELIISCKITGEGFELAPRVNNLSINVVPAIQRETLCEYFTFSFNEKGLLLAQLTNRLSIEGYCEIQIKNSYNEWKTWKETDILEKSKTSPKNVVLNCEAGLQVNPKYNVRIITYSEKLKNEADAYGVVGISNGFPNQVIPLPEFPVVGGFKIQVGIDGCWTDWEQVEDFDASLPADKHYILRRETGEILFGDGIQGQVPCYNEKIRTIKYHIGGGEKGNVKKGAVNEILKPKRLIKKTGAINICPASGGSERESINSAIIRARKELRSVSRVVTNEDYEQLALSTPGLRVARAKAFVDDSQGLPVVNVVVVPYSTKSEPVPGKAFLAKVCNYLSKYRLITTQIRVRPPKYVKVSVSARVFFKRGYSPDQNIIIQNLNSFLSPAKCDSYLGWPFGKTVYKSEIYSLLEQVDEVDYVENVQLFAYGENFEYMNGNIRLKEKYMLVCPGTHSIEVSNSRY